jgi:hypothetical protein
MLRSRFFHFLLQFLDGFSEFLASAKVIFRDLLIKEWAAAYDSLFHTLIYGVIL